MRWRDIGDTTCSVARSLSVVGDRWALLILREAFLRTRRFEDFQTRIGMTRHRLSARLRKLVEHGVFEKVRYQEKPARYEYRLTQKGLDLYPVIVALLGWGDRWMPAAEGPAVALMHRECGRQVTPRLVCPDCGQAVSARDTVARVRPMFRKEHRHD